ARAREEPEEHEDRVGERERGQTVRDQVETERDDEELAPAEPVGEIAEEQRPRDLPEEVDRGSPPDVDAAQVQGVLALQHRPDEARDRDLEPVEHPRDAERDHQPAVEPGPGQPVHARGHQAPDHAGPSLTPGNPHGRTSASSRPSASAPPGLPRTGGTARDPATVRDLRYITYRHGCRTVP